MVERDPRGSPELANYVLLAPHLATSLTYDDKEQRYLLEAPLSVTRVKHDPESLQQPCRFGVVVADLFH